MSASSQIASPPASTAGSPAPRPAATPAAGLNEPEPISSGPQDLLSVADHVRSVAVDDFVVLLDRRTSRYLSLNDFGALIWRGIEDGRSISDIAAEFAGRHAVPLRQVEADARDLCSQLIAAGLVVESPGDRKACRALDAETRQRIDDWIARWRAVPPAERKGGGGWLSLPRALAEIAAVEWGMRTGGMPALRRRLARHPLAPPAVDPARAWRIVEQTQRATALYVKKAWCLQRSTACAGLLRAAGVPAEVVIGVVPVPFAAHAWVEIGHHVVNDHASRTDYFTEIDRF